MPGITLTFKVPIEVSRLSWNHLFCTNGLHFHRVAAEA